MFLLSLAWQRCHMHLSFPWLTEHYSVFLWFFSIFQFNRIVVESFRDASEIKLNSSLFTYDCKKHLYWLWLWQKWRDIQVFYEPVIQCDIVPVLSHMHVYERKIERNSYVKRSRSHTHESHKCGLYVDTKWVAKRENEIDVIYNFQLATLFSGCVGCAKLNLGKIEIYTHNLAATRSRIQSAQRTQSKWELPNCISVKLCANIHRDDEFFHTSSFSARWKLMWAQRKTVCLKKKMSSLDHNGSLNSL